VGQTATRTLTIYNDGNSTLSVSSIGYPSGFSGDWSGGTITAGNPRIVNVTFAPTAAQAYGGTITVNSDRTSGTNTRASSGTGVPVVDRFTSVSLQGGQVVIGWEGSGKLQETEGTGNPWQWTDVPNPTNPIVVNPTGARKFYRLQRP
jgi:hypothetical protein